MCAGSISAGVGNELFAPYSYNRTAYAAVDTHFSNGMHAKITKRAAEKTVGLLPLLLFLLITPYYYYYKESLYVSHTPRALF